MKRGLVSACSLLFLLLLYSPLFATGAQEKAAPSVVEVSFGYSGGVWIEQYFDQVLDGMKKALVGVQVKKVVYPTYQLEC